MAEFLTTKGIALHIERIINEADKSLVIVSPYIQVSETFKRRLNDAAQRGVSIRILYGKDELNKAETAKLKGINNLELIFVDNLHAKCYLNEQELIIGSMNFYEFSEANNVEMGMLVDSVNDKQAFDKAVKEVDSLIKNFKKEVTPPAKKEFKPVAKKIEEGSCIRCQTDIPLNPARPYCGPCFSVWVQFENTSFVERFCHVCGKQHATDIEHPLCNTCYRAWVRKHPYAVM
jgi:HKD family nuclease